MTTPRQRSTLWACMLAASLVAIGPPLCAAARPPNIVLVITDDQGFGDLGVHGNPVVKTPHLDRLCGQSVELTQFYVSPVCSPTRSSLLTGRYNYRTGVVDTFLGRSMMYADEQTLAEMLRAAGYRTGIFGKWHLGDNYPLRPIDQGFDEALVHRGGGLAQHAGPPGNHYTDPVLEHNGRSEPHRGYCSDIFTTAAIRFLDQRRGEPFFVHLAFNCPHTPLEVTPELLAAYQGVDLSAGRFPQSGYPSTETMPPDDLAKVYAMVTNIDHNIGRLLARLDELELSDDTIVVFLTDNGPQQPRYNAGLRGRKGTVYEGGIRVPCFIRWNGHLPAGVKLVEPAAHIDLVPTLLAACGVAPPREAAFDGASLWPLLSGQTQRLPDRTLYFQWHRGNEPQIHRACAARERRFKLVQSQGAGGGPLAAEPTFELFDIEADPYEMHDLATRHPDVVRRMRDGYERWFREMAEARRFQPPRIVLGNPRESPTILSRQDWRVSEDARPRDRQGHWEVRIDAAGRYDVTVRCDKTPHEAKVTLRLGDRATTRTLPAGSDHVVLSGVEWPAGPAALSADVEAQGRSVGVHFLEIRGSDPQVEAAQP